MALLPDVFVVQNSVFAAAKVIDEESLVKGGWQSAAKCVHPYVYDLIVLGLYEPLLSNLVITIRASRRFRQNVVGP